MKHLIKNGLQTIVALFISVTGQAHAYEIIVESPAGESYAVSVHPKDSFLDVVENINQCLYAAATEEAYNDDFYSHSEGPYDFRMDFKVTNAGLLMKAQSVKKPRTEARNYSLPLTMQEQTDINFIVTTLGNSSLPKIKSNESSLKKAGDRIINVHPLQLLALVFTTEELKVAIRNMQGRSWVWKEFVDGITTSFDEENAVNNVTPFVSDFARRIKADVNVINSLVQGKKWKELVNVLINTVPRQGSTDRYNM